jgi:hypothetical protein
MLKIGVMESICRIGWQGNDPNDAVRASPHPTELIAELERERRLIEGKDDRM